MIRGALPVAVALALAGAAAVPAAAAPVLDQLVVFRGGGAKLDSVRSAATKVRSGRRRCRVPSSTPLAALVRSKPGRLRVRDFSGGACDPSSLFVSRIGPDRNRGQSGWVYKAGNRLATTGAADPSGPFGSGKLRRRTRVTWFYCVFAGSGCQRTLRLKVRAQGAGTVSARVVAFDDEGRGMPARGAVVRSGDASVATDSAGRATITLPPGRHRLHAEKTGAIRSFDEVISVK